MPEKIQFESKVISIGSESSDLYMTLDMVFLDNQINLNSVRFTDDFLGDVETNKDVYIGLPLVGDMSALVKGDFDKLTHKFNKKTGNFGTQALGSFVDFRIEKTDELVQLIATARIWKRFPTVCSAIEELFNSENGLKFSYECYATNYAVESGIKVIDKDENNSILSSCIVSNPANPNSVGTLLVAELLGTDFINNENILEEGEIVSMERNKDFTQEQLFANTKVHMSTEIAELDMSQVQRKIYNAMKEFIKDDWYYYDVVDMTMAYVIVRKYDDADYYKIDYSVGENEVQLSNMRKVTKTYQDIPEGGDPEMAEIKELQDKLEIAEKEVETLKAKVSEKETELATVNTTLATKETEIAELNTKLTTVSENLISKDAELAEIQPIKLAHETMLAEQAANELVQKQTALKDKYSKVLSAEILVELAEAINTLDESKLNAKVVEIAMASATQVKPNIETASRITDTVSIGKNNLVSKYVTIEE